MKYALLAALALAGCGDDGTPHEVDAAPHADAAPRPDAGDPCDYHEQDDGGNDTTAEATGLALANEVRICGTVRPHAPDGEVVDKDLYGVEIPTDEPVLVRLVSTDGAELDSMRVQLDGAVDYTRAATLR